MCDNKTKVFIEVIEADGAEPTLIAVDDISVIGITGSENTIVTTRNNEEYVFCTKYENFVEAIRSTAVIVRVKSE